MAVWGLIVPGAVMFALGVVQMLPIIRRRAADRGLPSDIIVPAVLAAGGFVFVWIGLAVR